MLATFAAGLVLGGWVGRARQRTLWRRYARLQSRRAFTVPSPLLDQELEAARATLGVDERLDDV